MKEVNSKSKDIIKQNIQDLESVFPEAVKDGQVDYETLKELMGDGDLDEKEVEKYEFTWPGKANALRIAQTGTTGTLRPDKESSKNWGDTENIYIEGDNLEVLKILQRSYYGKIDVIYIDPPYNTGKEFVYQDDYKDNMTNYLELTDQVDDEGNKYSPNTENDGRFHSNWLNMMYPRLRLARNLLSDNGVIFISISDNEQANLKKICDEIFSERDFMVNLKWTNKEGGGSSDSNAFRIKDEMIITYAKDIEKVLINGLPPSNIERYNKSDEHEEERGKYYLQKLGMGSIQYSESLDYPIEMEDGSMIKPSDNNNGERAIWRWSKDKYQWGVKNDYIEAKKNKDGIWTLYTKQYFKVDNEGNPINRTQPPMGVIDKYSSTQGTKELRKLDMNLFFSYPKPTELIKYLIRLVDKNDSIILDFFSGSSTTAHAVMDLNAKDNGDRKFIMVQLPEETDEKSEAYKAGYKDIAEIGRERIRRAGEKILEENPEAQDLDIGFKSFKLDSTNIKEWDPEFMDKDYNLIDMADNFIEGRSKEDVLYEIMVKTGIELSANVEEHSFEGMTIFNVDYGSLFVVLDDEIEENISQEIISLSHAYPMPEPVAVFKDIGFKDDTAKTNILLELENAGFSQVLSI